MDVENPAMDPVSIEYRIRLSQDKMEIFSFQLDDKTFDLISDLPPDPPDWTALSFRQCAHCKLDPEKHSHCPLALQLYDIVERFHDTHSIDLVELEVITEERRVIQTLAIQRAIASMLGLVTPVCGCPTTAFMKPMARFHLPLASEEETVFRVSGMYLLAQYFVSHNTDKPAEVFDGLQEIYADLHVVNAAIASRLKDVTKSDSLKNAVTLLDMYSILVPILLDDQLVELRRFFGAYLPDSTIEEAPTNHLKKAHAFSNKESLFNKELELVDDPPSWMKDLIGSDESPSAEAASSHKEMLKPHKDKEQEINRILGNSSLNLKLEPLHPENAASLQQLESDGRPKVKKAVFQLPDD